tara:strand:- start:11646 stop:12617 length:972 start_codon:yes stop_codon:yes gene_type:complete
MNILITGCAGFIGFHLTNKFLKDNKKKKIFGIDNINSYYDISLKKERLKILNKNKNFVFFKIDLKNNKKLINFFNKYKIDIVIHLAAQAGVRYSIQNPKTYLDNNINAFFNIIECSKNFKVKKFLFASTSSVYGDQKIFPLRESFDTNKPLSFYAATKKCNEVLSYAYSNIFGLKCVGMRFFTVYGPLGRPDMALFKFTKNISSNKKINVYNYGKHCRDFTYIDDVTAYVYKLSLSKQKERYSIYNIASSKSIPLKKFIFEIEKNLKIKSKIKYLPIQVGDVENTHASIEKIKKATSIKPKTNYKKGISNFVSWFVEYFNIKK